MEWILIIWIGLMGNPHPIRLDADSLEDCNRIAREMRQGTGWQIDAEAFGAAGPRAPKVFAHRCIVRRSRPAN